MFLIVYIFRPTHLIELGFYRKSMGKNGYNSYLTNFRMVRNLIWMQTVNF
jgi:hypothetical protein